MLPCPPGSTVDRPRQEYPVYTKAFPAVAITELPSLQVIFVLVLKESPVVLGAMVISPKKRPLPGSLPEISQRPASLGACMEACHAAHSVVWRGEVFTIYSSACSAGVGTLGRTGAHVCAIVRVIEGGKANRRERTRCACSRGISSHSGSDARRAVWPTHGRRHRHGPRRDWEFFRR